MLELPSKIANIISAHLKTEEKVVFFKKKGLFSKTYHILTNQRSLIVQKNTLVSEQSFLHSGEENIIITKNDELLTTQRLIALDRDEKGLYQIKKECSYLELGEQYIHFTMNAMQFGGAIPPELDSSFIDTKFLILTDHALKSFRGRMYDFKQIDALPLSDIASVDLERLKVLSSNDCCIVLRLRSPNQPRVIRHFLSEKRELGESLPKKIGEAAGVTYASPIIHSREGKKTFVDCYVKTDLKWPLKCANCFKETQELKYWPLKIEKIWDDPPHNVVGPKSVQYELPYCESCFGKKAVKSTNFNGVRAILEFSNNSYAEEFIHINN